MECFSNDGEKKIYRKSKVSSSRFNGVVLKGKPFAEIWPGSWKLGPPYHSFESFSMWWVISAGLVCHVYAATYQ